jgi:hypothetical protein
VNALDLAGQTAISGSFGSTAIRWLLARGAGRIGVAFSRRRGEATEYLIRDRDYLWYLRYTSIAHHWHPRQAYCTSLAVAEW